MNHLGIHPSETVPAALPHYELVFDKWLPERSKNGSLRYTLQGTRKHNIPSFEKPEVDVDSKVLAGDVLILGSVPSPLQSMSQFMRQVEFSRKDLSTFMIGGSRMVIDHLMSYPG